MSGQKRTFASRRLGEICLWVLAAVCLTASAFAHVNDTSLLRVSVQEEALVVEANLDLFTLSRITPLDENQDGLVHRGEVLRAAGVLEKFFRERLRLTITGAEAGLGKASEPEWQSQQMSASEDELHAVHVNFRFERARSKDSKAFQLQAEVFKAFGAEHHVIVAVLEGGALQQAVLSDQTPGIEYVFAEASPAPASEKTLFSVPLFQLGLHHILTGYDHLLFLLTLLVAASGVRQILAIVTAFTVAHSVTVALAVTGVLQLPEKLVECSIAASIAWVAAENLWRNKGGARWMQTFGFGLLHGFGFAEALSHMELPREGLGWSLVAFNTGVEMGQLLVVAPLFPLILLARRSKWNLPVMRALSFSALALALFWLVQRALA